VKQIMSAGGTAHFVKADTSKPADNEALVGETVKKFGALNIAVNNAGIGGPGAFTGDYPIDGWDKVIAVNLSGVFYGMRYQIPAMITAGGGSIVNMSSILGQVAFRGSPAYVAAKHGLLGLTKTAAVEYAQQNIRINSVGPGFIRTPLLETMNDEPPRHRGRSGRHGVVAGFRPGFLRDRCLLRGRRRLPRPIRRPQALFLPSCRMVQILHSRG
jgi:NAD(P)-dependent dehydrogenase (short-subunit alcohol dehydrogenase family)